MSGFGEGGFGEGPFGGESTGIFVEQMPDSGAPQVGITVTGLDPYGASTISVDVSWDGGQTWNGVRGASRVGAVGSAFFRDHVPPLNRQAVYRLVVHTGAATPPQTEATITVTSDTAWLQDPLNPRTAVPVHLDAREGGVILASGAMASAVWRQEVDTVLPMGASLPVSSIGQRVRAGSVPLRMLHDVASEGGALRRLLLSSGQLVLRGAPTSLLDPVAHIVVGDAEQTVYGSTGQVSEWDLSVQQVRPQSLRIVVPWWTYDQVRDLWAGMTYDQVKAARPGDTYLDWLRDPTVP